MSGHFFFGRPFFERRFFERPWAIILPGGWMKRFAIFMLIGPAVGFPVVLLRELLTGRFAGWEAVAYQLPFAYLFAVLPLLVMWLVDWLLFERLRPWQRIVALALVGYGASIGMLLIWSPNQAHLFQILSFGLVGATQGIVCSWLMSVDVHAWQRWRVQVANDPEAE
jgi:hypothetical protein